MTHSLTDEVILDVMASIYRWKPEYRAGADAAFCPRLEMRAAADWQLEQVIKFMEEHEQLFGGSGMIFILKDAMRPQQND